VTTLTKIGLTAGALTITAGAIISTRGGERFPVPAPGVKSEVVKDANTGKCWEVRTDGWTRSAPCPTPTPAILPRGAR